MDFCRLKKEGLVTSINQMMKMRSLVEVSVQKLALEVELKKEATEKEDGQLKNDKNDVNDIVEQMKQLDDAFFEESQELYSSGLAVYEYVSERVGEIIHVAMTYKDEEEVDIGVETIQSQTILLQGRLDEILPKIEKNEEVIKNLSNESEFSVGCISASNAKMLFGADTV